MTCGPCPCTTHPTHAGRHHPGCRHAALRLAADDLRSDATIYRVLRWARTIYRANTMATHTLFVLALASALGMSFVVSGSARADHGPGASAAGVSTLTAETLKPKALALELREDFTEFEDLSTTSISAKTSRTGSIDRLDRSFPTSISASYELIENLQIGLALPYYATVNVRDTESGETEIATSNPDGIGELWLTGKS